MAYGWVALGTGLAAEWAFPIGWTRQGQKVCQTEATYKEKWDSLLPSTCWSWQIQVVHPLSGSYPDPSCNKSLDRMLPNIKSQGPGKAFSSLALGISFHTKIQDTELDPHPWSTMRKRTAGGLKNSIPGQALVRSLEEVHFGIGTSLILEEMHSAIGTIQFPWEGPIWYSHQSIPLKRSILR